MSLAPKNKRRLAAGGRRPAKRVKLARGTTDFSPDDGQRGHLGVLASLVKRPDGTVRVVFEDARRGRDGAWKTTKLTTSRDYPAAILDELGIEAAELEQAGHLVIARLIAFEQVGRTGG